MTKVYIIQRFNDWAYDGPGFWEADGEEPLIYAAEEDARDHVEHEQVKHVETLRRKHEAKQAEVDAHNAKIDALEAAGLDPKEYITPWGTKARRMPLPPFEEPTDKPDEFYGVRYVEVEVL